MSVSTLVTLELNFLTGLPPLVNIFVNIPALSLKLLSDANPESPYVQFAPLKLPLVGV